ncbi:MAG TPA: 3-oxoacyl-[acyl-carrier-protein] synthase III C-terminal domain-containing protein [candidate division Zixibacteria bacterium]|nr:3-oxoacyl-[acyl-carrier-protein] synthase III C-terminal domain-containing protein [candidate division Zixibacteria bacterium]
MNRNPRISGVAVSVPEYRVEQKIAKEFARRIFSNRTADVDRLLSVFDNSQIDTRYFSRPLEWFEQPHSLSEKNQVYIESSTELCLETSQKLLNVNNVPPEEIDYIIYVNTTGLATPSIDARLINLLGLRQNIRRIPIWGLGCAGGAAGLSHAHHHLLGHPNEKVLLIACELCGLTFLHDDYSKSNLVATALFGEGAAAVLVTGGDVESDGLEIVSTNSRFFPDSLDVMGWNILDSGLQVVFAKQIPEIIEKHALTDFTEFLKANNLQLKDISKFLFHPGGAKVIEAYQAALSMSNGSLSISYEILRRYGNMSSVTVLFVLDEYFQKSDRKAGGYGLISALGPGFSSESLLLKL